MIDAHAMLNVLEFRKRAPRAGGSKPQRPSVDVVPDFSELASRFTGLQSKARGDIHDAIQMLDLAAQHARQLASKTCDPAMRKAFERHISMIEQLLQLARSLALKL
jgi:hypothetical protein